MKVEKFNPLGASTFIYSKKIILVSLILLIAIVISVLALNPSLYEKELYEWASRKGYDSYENPPLVKKLLNPVTIYNKYSAKNLPNIKIDIKFKELQKLYRNRKQALERGVLLKEEKSFVKAKIRFNNENIKVKLRLKGDWTDHLLGNKWSFRIHVKGKKHILGMRRFSLQHPKTRGYQGEIIFNRLAKHYGLLAPRYIFVNVHINGDVVGVMQIEEHFSKELLEFNMKKEGVIIKFDESLVWEAKDGSHRGFGGLFDNYKLANIAAFRSARIKKSDNLSRQYRAAVGTLKGFINGKLTASEVFDGDKMATFLVLSQYLGTLHGLRWHNLRFYFNPYTFKFEPIVFDVEFQARKGLYFKVTNEPIFKSILTDPGFRKSFIKAANIIDRDILNSKIPNLISRVEKETLNSLYGEYFLLGTLQPKEFKSRHILFRKKINEILLDTGKKITKNNDTPVFKADKYSLLPTFVKASIIIDGNKRYLEIRNILDKPILITKIFTKTNNTNHLKLSPIKVGSAKTITINFDDIINKEHYINMIKNDSEISVIINIPSENINRVVPIHESYPMYNKLGVPKMTLSSLLKNHKNIELNDNGNILTMKKGNWVVNSDIIIPSGYEFHINKGTTLNFTKDAIFTSYSPLNFSGTKKHPVIFKGLGTDAWQGLAIMAARGKSFWKHVKIENTSGIKFVDWHLNAGATFYKSDIKMQDCTFTKSSAEDALNIVRSKVLIENIRISETYSDGLDGDYINGEINSSIFEKIGSLGGGDAIDLSGSNIIINRGVFHSISDKAVSIGERSVVSLSSLDIKNSSIAVVSKDGSQVKVTNSKINNVTNYGFMAYMKKPEYGGSYLEASNIKISDTAHSALAQNQSKLILESDTVKTVDIDMEVLYSTIMKPGMSK